MSERRVSHHPLDRFRENTDDYTTYPASLIDRFVETGRTIIPGRPWPKRSGFYQWHIGDSASMHLADPLPWTLIEVRIIEIIAKQTYRVVVARFDGERQTLGGISIGDLIDVPEGYFYAVWASGETREDGEGSQKVYQEGSTRRFWPKL